MNTLMPPAAETRRAGSPRCRRHTRGITLTEIMFAFLILIVAALGSSGIISYGHRGTQKDYREVEAIQLLSDRMNQILAIPYGELDTLITTGNQVDLAATIFDGTPRKVILGNVTKAVNSYTVQATIRRQPVTFGIMPVDIPASPDYQSGVATSWRFDAFDQEMGRFDGSDAVTHPYKVLKIIVTVSWREPVVNVDRQIQAVSFTTDLD